jgi:hypothetical protein
MHEQVTEHEVGFLNSALSVVAIGEPGPGGAHFMYDIGVKTETLGDLPVAPIEYGLKFQVGDPHETINGITNEVLLAVLIHRMDGFQRGPFHCSHNEAIRGHLKQALNLMHDRTRERASRGVEGKALR